MQKKKVKKYLEELDEDMIVIADDTGLEIDVLNGEPGIFVRRWAGYEMTDDEIIGYCIGRLEGIPEEKRKAKFKTIVAFGTKESGIVTEEGTLEGRILEKPKRNKLVEGFPFEALFYITEYNLLLGELHRMDPKEKKTKGYLTHRARAFKELRRNLL